MEEELDEFMKNKTGSTIRQKAIEYGVKTMEQYEIWLEGYNAGYVARHEETMKQLEETHEKTKTNRF